MSKLRVALAEDHVILHESLKILLNDNEDIELILCAYDGADLLNGLRSINYEVDAIILDLNMPKMDGLSVLHYLKKESCTAKIIMHSSYNERDIIRKCIEMGANRYVVKGNLHELVEALKS